MELVNTFWLSLLAGSAVLSSVCGLSNNRRGAGATWLVMAAAGSGLYLVYELHGFLVPGTDAERNLPRLATVVGGVFAWPIMVPEAVEYLLAELGVLKPAAVPSSDA